MNVGMAHRLACCLATIHSHVESGHLQILSFDVSLQQSQQLIGIGSFGFRSWQRSPM
jgi:hypothetical protein